MANDYQIELLFVYYGKILETDSDDNISYKEGWTIEGKNSQGGIFTNFNIDNASFSNDNYNIYLLGILSLPGLLVNLGLNGGIIRIGLTGIFELNLPENTPLKGTISFNNLKSKLMNTYKTNEDGSLLFSGNCNYCLIDVIYTKSSEGIGEPS